MTADTSQTLWLLYCYYYYLGIFLKRTKTTKDNYEGKVSY